MIKIFKNLRRQDWGRLGISCIFILAQVWLDLKLPDYMSDITVLVQTPGSEMGDILIAGGKMLLCAFGSLLSAVIVGYLASKAAANLSMRLRSRVFDSVQSFSMREINGFSTASLITRSTNDITQIQMIVVMGIQVLLKGPVMAVLAILKIIDKGNVEWSVLTGGAVLFLLVMIIIAVIYALPKFRRMQTLTDNLNRVTRENLTGLKVVRAYNAEKYAEGKFEKANRELTVNSLKAQRAMALMMPSMGLVMNGISLGIYWIGAFLINAAALPQDKMTLFSNMVVFSSYCIQVVMAFTMMTMIFIMLPRAQVSARRIQEVLDTKTTVSDGTVERGIPGQEGTVEFRHVSFRYPDAEKDVLYDINFKVKKGQTIAFIGSTGSGKSTIVNLAARFYDATQGQVLIDGVDVRDYTLPALYEKIGYVPQKSVLFSGTVRTNVAYGQGTAPITEEDVREAVKIAQGEEFVQGLEDQYDGFVAQGGANFSGGQKQRLSIARAVCRKPEIYIFDDSFSALDYKTDRLLRAALKQKTADVTSIIVAQRIGTIRDADIIAVIDDGRIVGMGRHEQLIQGCEVYRQIAYSQLSKEELA